MPAGGRPYPPGASMGLEAQADAVAGAAAKHKKARRMKGKGGKSKRPNPFMKRGAKGKVAC